MKRTSLMRVASLKPEVEFEVIKLVMLRENYLIRIDKTLKEKEGRLDIGIIGLIDILRDSTLETVETIKMWETTQLDYPLNVHPFFWNGQNYLEKIVEDLFFLDCYPQLTEWLGFKPSNNPFIVPPSILHESFELSSPLSSVVFGIRPEKKVESTKKSDKPKFIKSPYNTPIINDASIIPSLSISSKLKRKAKLTIHTNDGNVNQSNHNSRDLASDRIVDIYETFITMTTFTRIKKSWKILCTIMPHLRDPDPNDESENLPQLIDPFLLESGQQLTGLLPPAAVATIDHTHNYSPLPNRIASSHLKKSKQRVTFSSSSIPSSLFSPGDEFAQSQQTFQSHLDSSIVINEPENKSHRRKPISHSDTFTNRPRSPHMWTPHEVILQRAVQKKGGELSALTAVATKGRTKLPWRKTRFERLEIDHANLTHQCTLIDMSIEDLYSKLTSPSIEEHETLEKELKTLTDFRASLAQSEFLLQYQLNHFKMLTEGGQLSNLNHQRKMKSLQDGQALDIDEAISLSLEDKMASKIQRRIYIKFGRVLRKALILKRNKAATMIQSYYRRHCIGTMALSLSAQTRLAIMCQKLYRGSRGKELTQRLRQEAEENRAVRIIQRIYRGYKGKLRFGLKREFVRSINSARRETNPYELNPGHIEELADGIDLFIKDYTVLLPTAVLAIIRAVLFMINGDSPEITLVDNSGYIEEKPNFAATVNWYGARLILLRKGRLLRRIRALVCSVDKPGPTALNFSDTCVLHLQEILRNIKEIDFEQVQYGKYCIVKLYNFTKYMWRAYELQDSFPEYFEPTLQDWFHRLIRIRTDCERTKMQLRMERIALKRIEDKKTISIDKGKRLGPIIRAFRFLYLKVEKTALLCEAKSKELKNFVRNLDDDEKKKILTNENLERTRELGVRIARRDFAEYIRTSPIPDEKRLKEMRYLIDAKELLLLDCRSNIILLKDQLARDRSSRNFNKLLKLNHIITANRELGIVMGDLLAIQEVWRDFVESIGGEQFIYDLIGPKEKFYLKIRNSAIDLMKRRRELQSKIDKDLVFQFSKVKIYAKNTKLKIVNQRWDTATSLEVNAEEEENKECAQRDADVIAKSKRQADHVLIPPRSFIPVIFLVDVKTPYSTKQLMVAKLVKLKFRVCITHQNDSQLVIAVQNIFDEGFNVILFVDRGNHIVARGHFKAIVRNLQSGLIPSPRMIGIDCLLSFQLVGWFTKHRPDFQLMKSLDFENSMDLFFIMGQIRRLVLIFEACLLPESDSSPNVSVNMMQSFHADFTSFLNDLRTFGSLERSAGIETNNSFHSLSTFCITRDNPVEPAGTTALNSTNMVLAATIACLLEVWHAPVSDWRDKHIYQGCHAFLDLSSNYKAFVKRLFLDPIPNCTKLNAKRVRLARLKADIWNNFEISKLTLSDSPARYILAAWCRETMNLIESSSAYGGFAGNEYDGQGVSYAYDIDWKEDVISDNVDNMIGTLFENSFQDDLIFENNSSPVTLYFDRKTRENVDKTVVGERELKSRVRVYYRGQDAYVGVDFTREVEKGMDHAKRKTRTYFSLVHVDDVVKMLHPNGVEIFEGRIKKYNIDEGGPYKWYELISTWARLDDIGFHFKVNILRTRYLLMSRIGLVKGYEARYEIFEERYGEVLILVHGVSPQGTIEFRVTREELTKLISVCDMYEEKPKLEALDTNAIASIYSDRLEISPPKGWIHFLENGALLPSDISRPIKGKLRLNRGPGRFMGRYLTILHGLKLVISLYELSSDSDIQSLRIVIYEIEHCQSIEYRLSPLERLTLFSKDKPLLTQILERMKAVYCNVMDPTRALLLLGQNFSPHDHDFEVEGDDDFDIVPLMETSEENIGMSKLAKITEEIASVDDQTTSQLENNSVTKNSLDDYSSKGDNDDNSDAGLDPLQSLGTIQWAWALYFDRTAVTSLRGNLTISIGFNVTHKGFALYVLDNRSLHEAYRFISLDESCLLLYDYTIQKLLKVLKSLDEAVLFDLLDELIGTVSISMRNENTNVEEPGSNDEQQQPEQYILELFSDRDDNDTKDFIVTKLVKHVETERDLLNHKHKLKVVPSCNVDIVIMECKNLTPNGSLEIRNSFCIVKFNMREVGRTEIQNSTLNPKFTDGTLKTKTTKGLSIVDSMLEVEVFDTDYDGRPSDFLGSLDLFGADLEKVYKSGVPEWYPLHRSNRLTAAENERVGGFILLQVCSEIKKVLQKQPTPGTFADLNKKFLNMMSGISLNPNVMVSQISNAARNSLNWLQSKVGGGGTKAPSKLHTAAAITAAINKDTSLNPSSHGTDRKTITSEHEKGKHKSTWGVSSLLSAKPFKAIGNAIAIPGVHEKSNLHDEKGESNNHEDKERVVGEGAHDKESEDLIKGNEPMEMHIDSAGHDDLKQNIVQDEDDISVDDDNDAAAEISDAEDINSKYVHNDDEFAPLPLDPGFEMLQSSNHPANTKRLDISLMTLENIPKTFTDLYIIVKFNDYIVCRTALFDNTVAGADAGIVQKLGLHCAYFNSKLPFLPGKEMSDVRLLLSACSLRIEVWNEYTDRGKIDLLIADADIRGSTFMQFILCRGSYSTYFHLKFTKEGILEYLNECERQEHHNDNLGANHIKLSTLFGHHSSIGNDNKGFHEELSSLRIAKAVSAFNMTRIELKAELPDIDDPIPMKTIKLQAIMLSGLYVHPTAPVIVTTAAVAKSTTKSTKKIETTVKAFADNVLLKIFFNDELVKSLVVEKNQKSGNWNSTESIDLTVIGHRPFDDCSLEIAVFDMPATDENDLKNDAGTFLGFLALSGTQLHLFLEGKHEEKTQSKRHGTFSLQESDKFVKQEVSKSDDDNNHIVTIQGKISIQVLAPPDDSPSSLLVTQIEDESIHLNKLRLIEEFRNNSLGIYSENSRLRLPLLSHVQKIIPNSFNIYIKSANGLHKHDSNRNIYVKVKFNGFEVGRTKIHKNVSQTLFDENDSFHLVSPRGQMLDACQLEIQVYDIEEGREFIARSKHNTKETFIGGVVIEGEALVRLLKTKIGKFSRRDKCHNSSFHFDLAALPIGPLTTLTAVKHDSTIKGNIEIQGIPDCWRYDSHHDEVLWPRSILFENRLNHAFQDYRRRGTRWQIGFKVLSVMGLKRFIEDAPPTVQAHAHAHSNRAYLEFRWNGQSIHRNNEVEISKSSDDSAKFATRYRHMYIPEGYGIADCYLQIILWINELCLGGISLHGQGLVDFLGPLIHNDIGNEELKDTKQTIPLSNVLSIPTSLHVQHVDGVLATCKISTGAYIREVNVRSLEIDKYVPKPRNDKEKLESRHGRAASWVIIKSPLKTNEVHWKYLFSERSSNDCVSHSSDTDGQLPLVTNNDSSVSFEKLSHYFHRQLKAKLELPAVNFVFEDRKVVVEDRICWRGRIRPLNLIMSSQSSALAFMSRSSRLVVAKAIKTAAVLSQVHFIKDTGKEEIVIEDQLPILVKEIVSEGAGLVQRIYRVEISANNGQKMGHTDIVDKREEFQDIIGVGKAGEFLKGHKDTWNMGAIFEYIVRERVVVDMSAGDRKAGKSARRDGMSAVSESQAMGSSLIRVIRDSDTAVAKARVDFTITEEDEEDNVDSNGNVNGKVAKVYRREFFWVRLVSRTHKLAGRVLRTIVLLQGPDEDMQRDPQEYFSPSNTDMTLSRLNLLFRCKDLSTKITHDYKVPGPAFSDWLPKTFVVDLRNKFRRAKFGDYLIENLRLAYAVDPKVFNFRLLTDNYDDDSDDDDENPDGD